MPAQRTAAIAAITVATLATTGCFVSVDAGYATRASFTESGASGVVRAGLGDVRHDRTLGDIAIRVDGTSQGSRAAIGANLALLAFHSYDHPLTPYVRGGVWLAPLRGGNANRDSLAAPSLELGAIYRPRGRTTTTHPFYFAGARADHWFTDDARAREATVATALVGVGWSAEISGMH